MIIKLLQVDDGPVNIRYDLDEDFIMIKDPFDKFRLRVCSLCCLAVSLRLQGDSSSVNQISEDSVSNQQMSVSTPWAQQWKQLTL